MGGGIKRWFCLMSDVCLSVVYIGFNSRTERPRKTKIGTEIAHVTRDSDTTFKVKRSKFKVTRPLWLIVLAGQHGRRVMVTYPYAYMTSPLAGLGGGISWRPPAYSLISTKSYCSFRCRVRVNCTAVWWCLIWYCFVSTNGSVYTSDRLFQACFPDFSTVCLELAAADSSDQRLSLFLNLDVKKFLIR